MRTMKFLSLITVLIVLVTLFTLVISQLNKDETKHEYGIAFPLEETETRLQMTLPSQQQLIKNLENNNNNEQATTTTETVATFSSTSDTVAQQTQQSNSKNKLNKGIDTQISGGQQQKNDDVIIGGEQQSGSTSSMSMSSTQQNNPDSSSDDDDNDDDDDTSVVGGGKDAKVNSTNKQDENSNPKLIFIERLMDLNFQRPPPPSPFVEVRDLFEESTKKDDNNKTNKDEPSKDETPWSNTFEQIRSKWENRLRKLTYPLQNTYSVVLRASNIADGSNDTGEQENNNNPDNLLSDINDKSNRIDQLIHATNAQDSEDQQQQPAVMVTPNVKFFYQQQSALPVGGGGAMNIIGSQSTPNPQANQLFRMAALSMMSKLFSAIRSQAMIPSKLDPSGHKMTNDLENPELDLDSVDDDDEIDHDERAMAAGAIPLPILVGQKSRNVPDSDPDSETESIRTTTIMFGRPSPIQYPMMGPRIPTSFLQPQPQQPQSLPNPLAAILQATAAAAARQQSYRRFAEQQQQQFVPQPSPVAESASHPQRLILLITHRPTPTPMAATANLDRDEPMMFHQSQSQPSYAYYSPLSPPSSPILYQTQPPQPSPAAMAQSQSSPVVSSSAMGPASMQQQVVEVPVPVYVPVHVRGPVRGPSPPQPMPQHQQQPTAIEQIAAAAAVKPIISPRVVAPASTGPIAIVYVHNNNNNNDQAQQPDERMVVNENAYSQQQQQQQPQMPTPAIAIAANPAAASNMESADPESSGNQAAIVRILFRPKSASMMTTTDEPSGLSFHRRLEQEFASEEDQSQQNAVMMSSGVQYPYDSRLQQWRDYQQMQQQTHQQPMAAMTHVILTATGIRSNDDETSMMEQDGPSSSIGYQQAYSTGAAGPTIESQFYFSDAEQQAQQSQQPSMVSASAAAAAAAQSSQPLVAASAATVADPSQPNDDMGNGHHHAFLILADPSDPSLPQNTQIGNPNQD